VTRRDHPALVLARQRRHLHVLGLAERQGRQRGPHVRRRSRRHRDASTRAPRARRARARTPTSSRCRSRSTRASAKDYLLLPHGMSVGRGYGPVVVALEPRTLASLAGKKIGVPGLADHRVPRAEAAASRVRAGGRSDRALRRSSRCCAHARSRPRCSSTRAGSSTSAKARRRWSTSEQAWRDRDGRAAAPARRQRHPSRSRSRARREGLAHFVRGPIRWALEHKDEVARALLAAETARRRRPRCGPRSIAT